jgi:hypothetical protein
MESGPHRRLSLSPVPRHPRNHGDGCGVVVERIVEKSTARIVFPTLTHTNYSEWSLVMRINQQAAGLWDAIEYGTADYQEDHSALVVLLRAVLEEMQASLACKESASDAWEVIRTVRMGGNRIKEAMADKLRRDFTDLQFKLGECVKDFVMCATTIVNQLWDASDKSLIRR